jgi:hypothetical protein
MTAPTHSPITLPSQLSHSENAMNASTANPSINIHHRHRQLFTLIPTLTLLLGTAGLAGCDSPFDPVSYVERARVVGARVTVEAEPERAWVKPGETATVTWLTVARQEPTSLQWLFILCLGSNGTCEGAPLATLSGQGNTAAVTFTVPEQATLGERLSPVLLGAICADGELSFDGSTELPTCTGSHPSQTNAAFTVPVQRGDATNHHPVLTDDRFELGGAPWTATTAGAPGDPCDASSGLPVVTAGKQSIRLVSDGNDRESYLQGDPPAPSLEELQISQFTTAGELKYAYSSILATDTRPDADVTIAWDPPKADEIPAAGMIVQFHFVARDLRDGIDWVHRALCVVP